VLDNLAGALLIVTRRVSIGGRVAVRLGAGVTALVSGAQLLLQGLVVLAVRLFSAYRRCHCCHR
jgi:hypothetical protein